MTGPYTAWHALWKDLPDQSTGVPAAFLERLETFMTSYYNRITALENTIATLTAGHTVQDEGTNLVQRTAIDFVGAGVTATDDSPNNRTIVTIPGGSGPAIGTIQDEGINLTQRPTINFTGSAVNATDNSANNRTNVSISAIQNSLFTAKGDLLVGQSSSVGQTLPAPIVDGLVLTSLDAQPQGMQWQTPANSVIETNGTAVTQRATINFTGSPVTVTDDAANFRTNIAISGVASPTIQTPTFDANSVISITAPGTYRLNIDHTTGNNDARIMLWEPRDDIVREVIVYAYISASTDTIYRFGPGTIAWDSGMGPYNSNTMPQWDVSPGSITVFRLTWMGQSYGWTGSIIASIPPYWTKPDPTSTVTNTESLGRGGANSQVLSANIYFMRNLSSVKQQWAINALTQCFSANMRQRMLNNGLAWEIGTEFTTDGPRSSSFRGSIFDFGGFFASVPSGPVTGGGAMAVVNYDGVNDSTSAKGGLAHEGGHAMEVLYYGGANSHPGSSIGNGSEPDTISQHSTLLALWNDCVSGGANLGTNHTEWFAECWRCWVLGDNNSGTTSSPAGGILGTIGPNTFGGTNTPGSRLQRFFNYMVSLGMT